MYWGFSGSEIEECVVSSLYDVFYEDEELSTEALVRGIQDTVPLSKTMQEEITRFRQWAEGRARSASRLPDQASSGGRAGRLEL